MPGKNKKKLIIYYAEKTETGFNLFEIDHDQRINFWNAHPTAKEISKKEYESFKDAAIEAKDNPVPATHPDVRIVQQRTKYIVEIRKRFFKIFFVVTSK